MRVNFIDKLFDPDFGLNHFRKADIIGYIHAKGMVLYKNGIKIGPLVHNIPE